jgi:hypothetical protein
LGSATTPSAMSWYSCRGYGHHRAISASNAISNSRAEAGDKREYVEAYVLGGEHVEGSDAAIFMLLGANAALADDARSECGPEITGLCGGFQFLVPTSAIQEKFAERAIDVRAFEIEQAKCLQNLFQSMSHRAFSGEL